MTEPAVRAITVDGAVMHYRATPWDARVMGTSTVEITEIAYAAPGRLGPLWAAFDAACGGDGVGLATTRISADDRALADHLQRAGFHYVETSHPLRLEPLAGRDFAAVFRKVVAVEHATPHDVEAVAALARDAFEFSRYHEDSRIHADRARARHARWIRDSFTNGDEVLVHRHRGEVAAVMSYRMRDDAATLHLGGTLPGLGPVAPMFWAGVLCHLRDRGVRVIDTRASVANLAAVRLHLALGFVPLGTDLGFTKIYPRGAVVSSPP
jgi:hypothetical protein